jgi:hypothetical protein
VRQGSETAGRFECDGLDRHGHCFGAGWILLVLVSLVAVLSGCKPGDYRILANHDTPEEKARAELLLAQAESIRSKADLDYQVGLSEVKIKQATAGERVKAENAAIIQESSARAEATRASGESFAVVVRALGYGLVGLEIMGGILAAGVIAVNLWTRAKRAPAMSRALTLTAKYNNVPITFIVAPDEKGQWQVFDPFGRLPAQSNAANALRANLLQLALGNNLALPAPRSVASGPQDGIMIRAWKALFGRVRPRAEVIK